MITSENGTIRQTEDDFWGHGAKDPTAISPKTVLNSQVMERVFTLGGIHVNGQPTRPGMYIVNGKKTMIK